VGPGTGGGTSRIRPPTPELLLIPPDRPRGVASQDVTIRFRVDARGKVRETRLLTSTGNRGYDERIRRWGMELQFRPAISLDTNRPVEAETEITISV
jgi:TonB family protein